MKLVYSLCGYAFIWVFLRVIDGPSSISFIVFVCFCLVAILLAYYVHCHFSVKSLAIGVIILIGLIGLYMKYLEVYIDNYSLTETLSYDKKTTIASDIIVQDSLGNKITLDKNKNYIIDFWFIGCAPCVALFTEWEDL